MTFATHLIIVESPSKCEKIESFLGPSYKCIASKGHIRALTGLTNIDIQNNFTPTFSPIKEKVSHVKTMRETIKQFPKENIILATDDDREGEGIAWHICDVFKLPIKTTQRITFHEITKSAVCNAVKNSTKLNMNLVKAQHARQILDILVGFKITPHLWKHIHNVKTNALSAGRCQTPALRLVYDNEVERQNNGTEKRYKTIGFFTEKHVEFHLGHEFTNETEMEDFLTKSQNFNHKLTVGKDKNTNKSAPKPFNTSGLLQAASNKLGFSPKQTMGICQTLYQNGFITYMRTESQQYAEPFLDNAKKYISQTYGGDKYVGSFDAIMCNDGDNPHEAVRVTDITLCELPGKEATLYRLIWRNTVESCMADARYISTTSTISTPVSQIAPYTNILEIPTFLGWKRVHEKNSLPVSDLKMYLKILETNEKVNYSRIESKVVVRNKTAYYTEASLIKKLESLGIGRPSTYATLVDTIQERGYVKRGDVTGYPHKCTDFTQRSGEILDCTISERIFGNEKSKLQIQSLGTMCIEFLVKHFDELFDYHYTENMESALDRVSSDNWHNVCTTCLSDINRLSEPVIKMKKETFTLDDTHILVFGPYGPSIKRTDADGNVTYFKTKTTKIDMKKLREGAYTAESLIEEEPILGEYNGYPIQVKKGKFGDYLVYGDTNVNIREWKEPISQLDLKTAIEFIEKNVESSKNKDTETSIRNLGPTMSIRSGKYGDYVLYKTDNMKKAKFFPLKKCPMEYQTCDETLLVDWIKTNHIVKSTKK